MTTPTPHQQRLAALFGVPLTPAAQTLIDRHQDLTDALTQLDKATHGDRSDSPTATAITAARDLATATQPLIDHLPAVIASLHDANAWRTDDGWCKACTGTPGAAPCADHANDRAMADAYEAALRAIT